MVSICGSTFLIDELVQRMTISGLVALSAFDASGATLTPRRLGSPTTSPRSRPTLAASMSVAPTMVIKGIAPGVPLLLDLSDHVIGLNILRGQYEPDEIRFVRGLLQPGDAVIDAGAHIGFFTMHMAAAVGPSGRVYAFEPLDRN